MNIESGVENLGPSLGYRPQDRSKYESLLSFLNISKRILHRRFDLGLSQEALGKMAGSKQSKVSDIELMKGNPRLKTLDSIARSLGLVVDLVPIEQSLKGTPFERPQLVAPQPMFLRGTRAAVVEVGELTAVGSADTGYSMSDWLSTMSPSRK